MIICVHLLISSLEVEKQERIFSYDQFTITDYNVQFINPIKIAF